MFNSNKLSISVGIPAYNEEANIAALIESIQSQKNLNGKIEEIIIVSDGSTDNTEAIVKKFHDKRIILSSDGKRLGKARRLNQIFRQFKGDVLILVDADCRLDDKAFASIIDKFYKNQKLGLLGCKSVPIKTNNNVVLAILSSIRITEYIRKNWNSGVNLFGFSGRLIALSRSFAKKVTLPKTLGDDTYIYLRARQLNVECDCTEDAICYYQPPTKVSDHLKQSIRFAKAKNELKKIFGLSIYHEYNVPNSILIKAVLLEIVKNPIQLIEYYAILRISRLLAIFDYKNINSAWSLSQSTKNLNH